MFVSSVGHVKSGVKLGRPRSKAKQCSRSIVSFQRVGALRRDGVPFGEGTNDLLMCGKVKTVIVGAIGKPSLNRALESHIVDPKPV